MENWIQKMPKLGFGMMRLPQNEGTIDLDKVCNMVDSYMEHGLNYFDTAYVYHGGMSEVAIKEALVKRYSREDFYIATKLPAWEMKEQADCDRIFEEQLDRTGTDYFDFYLLHSLEDGNNYETYEKYNCFEWAMKKKEEGKIRHFGFSYHGSPELLIKVLDKHPEVEFVQIQLNYADWDNPVVQSGKLYQILHEREIPIIVMEPVKGGTLANMEPKLENMMKAVNPKRTIASWALRFVGSLEGIMTILSGMSTEEQMLDNLQTFTQFQPLNGEEYKVVASVVKEMQDMPLIPCTGCRYCVDGCPSGILIPDIFRAVNTKRLYPMDARPGMFYRNMTANSGKASDCISCGQCEDVCPQHLPIIELIREASEKFD
ncbi:MAG: 4Fe-4S dicluster domain-containing protein [Clostridia bacterium]|nr:4Fe-4S dicluster domain-containing protein [Clostridia bacterium]